MAIGSPLTLPSPSAFAAGPSHDDASADDCNDHAPHAAAVKSPFAKCGACTCCVVTLLPSDVHFFDTRLAMPLAATPLRVAIAEFLTSGLDRPPRRRDATRV